MEVGAHIVSAIPQPSLPPAEGSGKVLLLLGAPEILCPVMVCYCCLKWNVLFSKGSKVEGKGGRQDGRRKPKTHPSWQIKQFYGTTKLPISPKDKNK